MKIKRVLPLLISLCMAGGVFAGLAGCNNGGSSEGSGHKHQYENWTSDGATKHTGTCTADGDCDTPTKTESHDTAGEYGSCSKCGEMFLPADHEHTWSEALSYADEDGHYLVTTCTNHAPMNGEMSAHNYNGMYKCRDCGYKHEHVRTEGNVFKNGSGHYIATTCLSHRILKENVSAHVFDNDEDTTCNDCGYVRVPVHQHTYADEWINAEELGHYKMATCAGHTDQQSEYYDHEFAAGSNTCACGYTVEADTSVALTSTAKIYIVGDSTVCSFTDKYYLPRYGYGTQLAQYLNVTENQIVNLAISGRSSKSYLTEDNYATLKTSIKAGDYLIISFGHNDEKSDDSARYTSPVGDHTTAGSFQKSLYDNYVKMATDKGATPILCTPITRYDAKGTYEGSKVHVTADGDYAAAIKALGAATDTTVIDLTKLTSDFYKSNNTEAQYFHAHTSYEGSEVKMPTGRDDTHINKYGAEMVSYLFANALKDTDNSLAAQVITNKLAPTHGTHYPAAVNGEYVAPDYEEFNPDDNKSYLLTDDWYKTYMGKFGSTAFTSECKYDEADGKFTVGESTVKSKIEAAADGFIAAFMQVDARKNFTASATVTVKSVNSELNNSQGGFGLMLRDDIYVNKIQDLSSNYVAAGILNKKAPIFSRESTVLSSSGSSAAVAVGDTHTLSITRVGQVVTVTVDSTTKTFTDFDFLSVDGDYMYLCLFANRGIVAEFTDVQFTITGNSQGA